MTKHNSIRSRKDLSRRSNGFKCCIAFAIILSVVSKNWNNNGPKLLLLCLNDHNIVLSEAASKKRWRQVERCLDVVVSISNAH